MEMYRYARHPVWLGDMAELATDYRTLAKIREGLFSIQAIFGRAYFRAMLIFESCLFKN